MRDLCITTYVSGKEYVEFIPVYIYSILKTYPDYGVIIFCGEVLPDNVRESLICLKSMGNFSVIERYLEYIPNNFISKTAAIKCKRWLIFSDEFIEYESLYIGDIDIFILPEDCQLHQQHLEHCRTIGLEYSNIVRCSDDKRISGLHFIKTKSYFHQMLPVVKKYTELFKSDQLYYPTSDDNSNKLYYPTSDEYLLYNMVNTAGLGICPRATGTEFLDPRLPSFRPEHGIHLAVFRNFMVKKRRVSSKNFQAKMKTLKIMIDDPVFRKIENNFDSKMIKRIFSRIHKYSVR